MATEETRRWRRTVRCLVPLALSLLATVLAATAQPVTKVHRIGRLSTGIPPAEPDPPLEVFRQGLRDFGYVEGQNLVMERRYAEDRAERLPELAAELVQLNVDVLVALGNLATRAAKQATGTLPIVTLTGIRWGKASSPAWPTQAGISRA